MVFALIFLPTKPPLRLTVTERFTRDDPGQNEKAAAYGLRRG